MAQIDRMRREFEQSEELMGKFIDVLYQSGNDIRFKILWMVYKKERTIKEIAEVMDMSLASISQHFLKLRKDNLVDGDRRGRTIYFTLHPENDRLLRKIFREFENQVKELK